MTRAPHIQPLPVWPTAPGISSAVRTAPLLLEEKGLGDEVDWPSEQRSVTEYYTPYTFSAKERDLETGYSYFGARYYDAGLSIWLSVDPLSDKYPSMSAYMYCAGNPVMLVDPDGMQHELPPISRRRIVGLIRESLIQTAKADAEHNYRSIYQPQPYGQDLPRSYYIIDNQVTSDFSGIIKRTKSGQVFQF